MHVFLKKHIYLKNLNTGKYKILSIATSNIILILITIFYKNYPIIIQKINDLFFINFIFTKNDLKESNVPTLFKDFIYEEYNTDDYITFCLLESFNLNLETNIYLFKDKFKVVNFFDYENIVDLYF